MLRWRMRLSCVVALTAATVACATVPGAQVPPSTGTSSAYDAAAYALIAGGATAAQLAEQNAGRSAPPRRTYCAGEYNHDCYAGPTLPPANSGNDALDDGDLSLAEARSHTLTYINGMRSLHGVALLELDDALTAFAQEGSDRLAHDHRGHGHFIDEQARCPGCGENQSDPRGWHPGPARRQIDEILALMMDEGPGGGHHDNILDPRWTRLGVGITNPGGEVYLTTDFAP
jgi:uncharacterized protein YkwD